MKINSTVALSLTLLLLMIGAGYMSGVLGFTVGSEAIKGVTQPDARPTSKIKQRQTASAAGKVEMLKEEDILAKVKARIEGKGKAKPEPKKPNKQVSTTTQPKAQLVAQEVLQPGFPLINRDRGIILEVLSARYTGGALQLKLNFKNEGEKTVKFLYSFLDVKDERGRAISANTEGLPTELPPNGKTFSGIVKISSNLVADVKKLSLRLTDYPDQQIQLQVPAIPVEI